MTDRGNAAAASADLPDGSAGASVDRPYAAVHDSGLPSIRTHVLEPAAGTPSGDALMVQDVWPGNRKGRRGPNVRRGDAFTLCAGKAKAGVLHVGKGADLEGMMAAAAAAASGSGSDCRDAEMMEMVRLRLLTPVECERLQGLPDDHTRWGADGAELSDTRRYGLVGRAVPPPAVRAIASRIPMLMEREGAVAR